jgi:alpha-amylase
LRRRPEAYHGTLRDQDAATLQAASDATGQPASIHERLAMKEAGLAARLHYDAYERRSGLIRFLAPATDVEAWATAQAIELGDAVDGAFEIAELGLDRLVATRAATVTTPAGAAIVGVTKTIELGGDRRAPTLTLTVAIHNRSAIPVEARIGLEWTLMLLGGGANPAAWWDVDEVRSAHDAPGKADSVSHLAQGNDYVGIALSTSVSEPASAWWAPVETVSNSEGGFERVYQGAGLLLSWPVALAPDGTWSVTATQAVTTDRDAAEAAPAIS